MPTPKRSRLARLRATVASTPGRFAALMAAIIVLSLGYGTAALTGSVQRANAVNQVRITSGPLTVSAQSLYRSLYDADATAAAAFLAGGAEPADLRQRYRNDIAVASAELARAAAGADADAAAIAQLSTNLPIYTGLIETARTDNRAGLPVGAAYLREASGLMHLTLLPAALTVYTSEHDRLKADADSGGGFPWLAFPLGIVLLGLLLVTARQLTRRTNRLLNVGIAGAFLAVLSSMLALLAAWGGAATHLHNARTTGSAQVDMLKQIRIAVLDARGDESLTLVARGSGSGFEESYQHAMTRLIGDKGNGGLLASAQADAADPQTRRDIGAIAADLRNWQDAHNKLRALDDGGDYPEAVAMAIGAGTTDTPAYFNRVDATLEKAINKANDQFTAESRAAANSLHGADVVVTVLTLIAIASATVGIQRRIAEYR